MISTSSILLEEEALLSKIKLTMWHLYLYILKYLFLWFIERKP